MEKNLKRNKTTATKTIAIMATLVSIFLIFGFTTTVYAAPEFPVNASVILTAKISNLGSVATDKGFNNYFQIASSSNGEGTIVEEPAIFMAPLISNLTDTISTIHTFTTIGTYSVRACADKTNDITEKSELNNCGEWLNILIYDPDVLPGPGENILCANGADNPNDTPSCTMFGGKCINDATNPPTCTSTTCSNGATNPPACTTIVNKCLLVDTNPLEFTDTEKARLAELLRKFYLIAPNLKSEDDINIVYSEIIKFKNFKEHLDILINQCEVQTSNPTYKNNGGPTLKFTNPWYNYKIDRGSYLDQTKFDCKYVQGWFSGTGSDGQDCDSYNKRMYTATTPARCDNTTAKLNSAQLNIANEARANSCTWNRGAYIFDMDKILNIW